MSRMIEDMLDLARARLAGGIPLKRERTDLAALVHRVVQEHQAAFPDRQISCFYEGDTTGEWDADRLAQVASNLVGNALQHGEPTRVVSVHLRSGPADMVTLSVTNGGTIPAEVLPRLFDPFRGGERPLTRSEGLGLGLYIVQQIVLAHQGSIEVHSEETHTVFTLRMPRVQVELLRL
jgi:two-component system, sensor histidine kinase and response regulator